jgi:outer membrane protein assembly factor BamE (lipoprotein component of BamABCDE complex)
MSRSTAIVLLLAALAAPSCFLSRSTVNEPLRGAEIEKLLPGKTTAAEVTQLLGAPSEVVQLGARTAYRYDFSVRKRGGFSIIVLTFLNEDARSDRIWLFFDEDDLLTHAGSTSEAANARYAMPWQDVHDR